MQENLFANKERKRLCSGKNNEKKLGHSVIPLGELMA